jgi:transposase InsO family protein
MTWFSLEEILELVYPDNPKKKRSAVYRTFVANEINTKPQKEKDKAKKFKEYEPGYIHLDVTYLPKINGVKHYLYVAIDRATRFIYYKIYNSKTAKNTVDFMQEFKELFPIKDISHILTDNGLEFTNKLIMSKKGKLCKKPSLLDEFCIENNNIEHRLIKPFTPKTNGMVERVNGTIKDNTIKKHEYQNLEQMQEDLLAFLQTYNLYKLHGGLRKELNVKTPINAIEKWYEIKPEIFKDHPTIFKNKILNLTKIKQE